MPDVRHRLSNLSDEQRRLLAQRLSTRARSAGSRSGIARQPRNGMALPVSFAQQRFWFLQRVGSLNAAFNVGECHTLRGPLDVVQLHRSLNEIVRRHEVLRTTFDTVDGQPVQRVAASLQIDLPLDDLALLDPSTRAETLRARIREEGQRPWALESGPLLRARLFRVSADEHVLLVLLHHIVADGWSKNILVRELTALYQAFSAGQPAALPELPIQYADFAVWQREWVQTDDFKRQLAYWTEHLADLRVLKLSRDGDAAGARGVHQVTLLPRELAQGVRGLSQQEGVTLFMTLLAAFSILLSRYTGERDIAVGSPIANRNRAEVENLIGCFMNPLPLRTMVDGHLTFRELLARVKQVAVGAYANQDVPFDVLVRTIQPERSVTASPLFQVMFLLHNFSWQAMHLSDEGMGTRSIGLDGLPLGEGDVLEYPGDLIYPVVVEAIEIADRLLCCFEFGQQAGLAFRRAPRHFRRLLESIVANPDARVSDLALLTDDERIEIVETWNPPALAEVPLPVHERIARQARLRPEAIAVESSTGHLTYAELDSRANRLARWLLANRAGVETRVGVLLDRSLEMVTAILGVLKAGAAYVPMDPAYPDERLAYMARDAGMPLLITTRPLLERHGDLGAGFQGSIVCLDEMGAQLEALPGSAPAAATAPASVAYVIYTSGSTGAPKGVLVPHGALANYTEVAARAFAVESHDRVLQFASIGFDTAAEEIFPCLTQGATLVLRTGEMLGSAHAFLEQCSAWRISVLDFPTAYWHELTRQMVEFQLDLPKDVRLAILGGERAQPERVRAWQARFGERVRLLNTYGPTEATIVSTSWEVPRGESALRDIPIGRPIPGARVYIVDARLQPVPVGVAGEIYIGGIGVARGYLHQPALTAERFVPDPFSAAPGARLYRTGDQARYLPGGEIEFLGRVDDQVKIRGFRVELSEIEAALLRDPDIEHAAVLLREDGGDGRRLAAYVVVREPAVTAHDLRARMRSALPEYMVPDAFVLLDRLPLTTNGKVDLAALPAPDGARLAADVYAPPQTQVEQQVAAIWAEVLGIQQVGLDDNFFELGGHSLLVIQLHGRLRVAFGDRLSVIDLFTVPTVRQLAARLAGAADEAVPALASARQRAGRQRDALFGRRAGRTPGAPVP